jgi:ribonuclease HI
MADKKFYVVWKGRKAGIFDSWKECEVQVKGMEGAVYKSFPDEESARLAFSGNWKDYIQKKGANIKRVSISRPAVGNPVWESWSVDAACSGNPGVMEYRGVETQTGKQIFHQGPFPLGTNNIGEFLAIVHALALLKKSNNATIVYSDSRTAIKWVKDKAAKTKLPRTRKSEALHELLDRAVAWLNANDYPNPVLKWETEKWGEIPADFGRK